MTDEIKMENTVDNRVLTEIEQLTESGASSGDAAAADGRDPGVYPKRYFDLDDGDVSYTVVARDLEHAEQIMRDAGIEFLDPSVSYDEAKASGAFDWSEMSAEAVARTRVHRCEAGRPDPVPLTECDIGDWFCSEW